MVSPDSVQTTIEQFTGIVKSGGLCAVLAAVSVQAASSSPEMRVRLPWDWSGVIGTGQSLSVGAQGLPVISTNQPYGNLKLSTGRLPWPVDPNDTSLTLAPLVEPVGRLAPNYPSSWPENIDGETPHSAMATIGDCPFHLVNHGAALTYEEADSTDPPMYLG